MFLKKSLLNAVSLSLINVTAARGCGQMEDRKGAVQQVLCVRRPGPNRSLWCETLEANDDTNGYIWARLKKLSVFIKSTKIILDNFIFNV